MRRHGYHLREPDANNRLSTRGFHMKSPRLKAVGTACFEKVLKEKSAAEGPAAAP